MFLLSLLKHTAETQAQKVMHVISSTSQVDNLSCCRIVNILTKLLLNLTQMELLGTFHLFYYGMFHLLS